MLLVIIVLLLLFGGGGGYYGYSRWGTGGGLGIVGTVVLIALVLYLFGGVRWIRGSRRQPLQHATKRRKRECCSRTWERFRLTAGKGWVRTERPCEPGLRAGGFLSSAHFFAFAISR